MNGADVNSVDSGQRSALLSACWQGHLVIADILLTAGANVNHQCGQVRGSRVMYSEKAATPAFSLALIFGFDLVSKEMIENNFNNKKEMKANIELKLFGTQSPCQS